MKRAYINKKFKPESLALIEACNKIVRDYQANGYKLTLRQIYYQLVSKAIIENTLQSYNRVGSMLNDARMAGLMDWDAIEDRTRNLAGISHWTSPASVIESAAYSYRMDKWVGQPNRVEIWVEKEALAGVIKRAANALDVDWMACRGYMSQSEMHEAALRYHRMLSNGQQPKIIHLGDHDPSGIDMTRDINDRLGVFLEGLRGYRGIEVDRIALNMAQVDEYNPPPNPAKTTDSRFESYEREFGDSSWELDAIEPLTLDRLIREAVAKYRDDDLFDEVKARETSGRTKLEAIADNWQDFDDSLTSTDDDEQMDNLHRFHDKVLSKLDGQTEREDDDDEDDD
jgi:hypothetical protein